MFPIREQGEVVWKAYEDCRWHAPDCLRSLAVLERRFTQHRILFVSIVETKDASLHDYIKEMLKNAGDLANVENLRALLYELSKSCNESSVSDRALPLLACESVFPVRDLSGTVRLLSGTDGSWFIADRSRHYNCFFGTISMLDWDVKNTSALEPLLQKMNLEGQLLSNAIEETTETTGNLVLSEELTQQLRAKAEYCSLLATDGDRELVRQRMNTIELSSAEGLKLRRSVNVNGVTVYGEDEAGDVVVRETGEHLHAYCDKKCVEAKEISWALVANRLCSIFNLEQHNHLLLAILTTTNRDHIKDTLDRAGVWKDEYFIRGPVNPSINRSPLFVQPEEDFEESEDFDGSEVELTECDVSVEGTTSAQTPVPGPANVSIKPELGSPEAQAPKWPGAETSSPAADPKHGSYTGCDSGPSAHSAGNR